MKKMMAVVMAVLMLCLLTGCAKKQAAPNGIMEAVGTAYEAINKTDSKAIRVAETEDQYTVIQVDMVSDTGTIVNPYMFAQPGIDFYKIEHSEENFTSVLAHTVQLLGQMQESEEHKAVTEMMNADKLPDGLTFDDIGFMNLGYVPDPLKRCEIIFMGMSGNGEGNPLRDEVYAFCRFGMMNENKSVTIMNVMVADQNSVYAIAQQVHQTGMLPAGVEAWMLRKLGL